jgi:hypothetical protein
MTTAATTVHVGSVVQYRLDDADLEHIIARAARALGDPAGSAIASGISREAGAAVPLMVQHVHGRDVVSGWTFLPALEPLWLFVARRGDEHGEWTPITHAPEKA